MIHTRRGRFIHGDGGIVVVHAVAQLDEHRLVLILHQLLDDALQVLRAQVLGIAGLARCDDSPTIREQVSDYVRMVDSGVLGLNVIELALVTNIRVVTNDTYFSNREAPPVTNANVVLTDLSNNAQYNFAYSSNGNYTYILGTTDTISKRDHQYRLDVTIDGTTYTSLATQKRTAVMSSPGSRIGCVTA